MGSGTGTVGGTMTSRLTSPEPGDDDERLGHAAAAETEEQWTIGRSHLAGEDADRAGRAGGGRSTGPGTGRRKCSQLRGEQQPLFQQQYRPPAGAPLTTTITTGVISCDQAVAEHECRIAEQRPLPWSHGTEPISAFALACLLSQ